jgi:RNase H-fold protein (predicted Holliday junction resolvase)
MTSSATRVLAIDPGRQKVGVALAEGQSASSAQVHILWCEIWPRDEFGSRLRALEVPDGSLVVALGDATGARELAALIAQVLPDAEVSWVDERNSTLEARGEYWAAHPPQGWRRLVPLGLQSPPCPIDDFAAVVLARRFFAGRTSADDLS